MRKLSKDFAEAKKMRDDIIKQMNLTLKKWVQTNAHAIQFIQ
jgi:hypothetical protein